MSAALPPLALGEADADAARRLHRRIVDGAAFRAAVLGLFNDPATADVLVTRGARQWHLHGCILAAWSPIWREQYGRGERTFALGDGDVDAADELLRYLYSGELLLTAANAPALLALAHALRLDALHRRIVEEEERARLGLGRVPSSGSVHAGEATPPLRESNSSLSSASAAAAAHAHSPATKPPLPTAPKPLLSPRGHAPLALRPTTLPISAAAAAAAAASQSPAPPGWQASPSAAPRAGLSLPGVSSASAAAAARPPLPSAPKPPLSPRPRASVTMGSRIAPAPAHAASAPSSPHAPPVSPRAAPLSTALSAPGTGAGPVTAAGGSPRSEQVSHATPVPSPVPALGAPERRNSFAGAAPGAAVVEEEAARKAREAKLAKLRKEKERAEREQSKRADDSAVRHQMELLARVALIEAAHARIEAEARERERRERKEEEKKRSAQAKRASMAPWQPSARPQSIRPNMDD